MYTFLFPFSSLESCRLDLREGGSSTTPIDMTGHEITHLHTQEGGLLLCFESLTRDGLKLSHDAQQDESRASLCYSLQQDDAKNKKLN